MATLLNYVLPTPARAPIRISNCPITGLIREITQYNFKEIQLGKELGAGEIIIELSISRYKDVVGVLELVNDPKQGIINYVHPLIASNNWVDYTQNGRILTVEECAVHKAKVDDYNKYLIDKEEYDTKVEDLADWNKLPGEERSFTPKPIVPEVPVEPERVTFFPMLEYNFYAYVFGNTKVNVPATIRAIIAQRVLEGKI